MASCSATRFRQVLPSIRNGRTPAGVGAPDDAATDGPNGDGVDMGATIIDLGLTQDTRNG
jgi:hypothetical protein